MSRNLRLFLCTIATIYGVSRASAQSFLGPIALAPVAIESSTPLAIVRWNNQICPQAGTHDTAGPRIVDPQADVEQPIARVAELPEAVESEVAADAAPELELVDAPSITSADAEVASEAVDVDSVLLIETTEVADGSSDAEQAEASRDIPNEEFETSLSLNEEYQPYDLPSTDIVLVEIYPAEARVAKNFVELPSDVAATAPQDNEAAAEIAAVQAPDDDSIDSHPDVATIDAVEEVRAGESDVEVFDGADDQPVADYNDDDLFALEGWDHAESDNDPSEDAIVPSTDDAAATDADEVSQQAEELGMPQPPAAEIAATDDLNEADSDEPAESLEIAEAEVIQPAAIDPAVEEAEALLAEVLDEIEVEAIMAAEAQDAEALANDVAAINNDLADAAADLAASDAEFFSETEADDSEFAEFASDIDAEGDESIADEMLAQAVDLDDVVYDDVVNDDLASADNIDDGYNHDYTYFGDHEVAVDEVAVDEVAVDEVAVDEVAVDEVAVDEVAVDEVAVDEVAVDEVAVDEVAVDEVAVDEVAVDADHEYGFYYDYDYYDEYYGFDVAADSIDEVADDDAAADDVQAADVASVEQSSDEIADYELVGPLPASEELASEEAAIDAVIQDIAAAEAEAADDAADAVDPVVAQNDVPNQCMLDELQWQLSFLAGSEPELQWAVNPSQLGARIAEVLIQASEALASLAQPVVVAEAPSQPSAVETAASNVEPGPVSECTPVDAGRSVLSVDEEPVADAIVAPPVQEATIQIAAEPSSDAIVR
ncbi:hypothetical protein Mal33_43860 [Rosistilla oblonga]|uniref:Uncharacterized protein n=1 Tax=Rosistilla oblonga TaxID=2527990 RepID=A0A518IZ56_9BACT|nr:hypothetical protein [Rosistilla oblonga]QDV58368.1 hypothetical protein Mal33_43860 [Rosistilla oblonga]